MKCRACWTDKAYLRREKSLKTAIYSCFGLLPFKCHHCYHKFWAPWFTTWGQTIDPPKIPEPTILKKPASQTSRTASRRRAA